ncbi:MAG: winged helix-turn-helix transcriptional regulator [Clostridia bacterium]|nr:winged helix-turn-helix transcriptional regulator [Clostridia bacterium]
MEKIHRIIKGEEVYELADFMSMFADSSRLKILAELLTAPLCVNHICKRTGMTQSAVSHQLATLRRADIVRADRSGKNVVYSIADEHIGMILSTAVAHIEEKV